MDISHIACLPGLNFIGGSEILMNRIDVISADFAPVDPTRRARIAQHEWVRNVEQSRTPVKDLQLSRLPILTLSTFHKSKCFQAFKAGC